MKEMTMDQYLLSQLKRETRARLGFIELLILKREGKRDGLHSLPREDAEGNWTSPTIQKEINACNEAHNRIYGTLQVKLEEKYKRALELAENVSHNNERLEKLRAEMPMPVDDSFLHVRKHGEDKLTDSQIYNRRLRECSRGIERIRKEINKVREETETFYKELIELKNYLCQVNHEADIVCERIRCHTQQRIDFYWNFASHTAYESKRIIPPAYVGIPVPNIVDSYRRMHEAEEQLIEETVNQYNRLKEAA